MPNSGHNPIQARQPLDMAQNPRPHSPYTEFPAKDSAGPPTVFVRLDRSGKVLWASAPLFDNRADQLRGISFEQLFPDTCRDRVRHAFDPATARTTQRLSMRDPESRCTAAVLIRPSSSEDEEIAFFAAVVQNGPTQLDQIDGGATEYAGVVPMVPAIPLVPAVRRNPLQTTILVADDEPMLQRLVARILNMGGYQVLTANDSDDCRELFEANRGTIGLAILDYNMPGLPIDQLVREMSTTPGGPSVVIATGHPRQTIEESLPSVWEWSYLQKPFSNSELLALASRLLPLPDD